MKPYNKRIEAWLDGREMSYTKKKSIYKGFFGLKYEIVKPFIINEHPYTGYIRRISKSYLLLGFFNRVRGSVLRRSTEINLRNKFSILLEERLTNYFFASNIFYCKNDETLQEYSTRMVKVSWNESGPLG